MKAGLSVFGLLFVLGVLLLSATCVRGLKQSTPALTGNPTPSPVTRTFGDVTVHVLHTGWVSSKQSHRSKRGPDAMRLLAILTDNVWTEWMPVYVFAVVHPEGVWLIDAGMSEATLDFGESGCDAGNRFFYQNFLRFLFEPSQRVDRQLNALGFSLDRIKGVVFTHRHADHSDAFNDLPATVQAFVGEQDWPAHTGALPCRWPKNRTPVLVGETGTAFGAFPHSLPLTVDARLRIVPLTGHSPGHLGAMLTLSDGRALLFAGDSSFSVEQVETGTIAGIVEVPELALRSLELTRKQLAAMPTFLLPAHDSKSLERFSRDEVTVLKTAR